MFKKEKKQKKSREHSAFYNKVSALANNRFFHNSIIQATLIALFIMLIIEGFEHKNPLGFFMFIARNPAGAFINTVLIFATLSIAWLFQRRIFFYCIISTMWLAIGVTNGIILLKRMTPFTTADLKVIDMAFDILPTYFNNWQLAIIVVGLIAVLAGFVLIFILAPKRTEKIDYKKSVIFIVIAVLVAGSSWTVGVKTKVVASYFENLWDAYYEYGVPYCFISTWLNKGISKPKNYSEEEVKKVIIENNLNTLIKGDKQPNFIFLQLESFIDPTEVKGLEFSKTPVPFFKSLKEDYSSGYLTVPVIGGGTANTEYEVMSGMSMTFFGPGEYPYKTILKNETAETMAYNLKDLGYSTHAIHNHRGAFYNRNIVFSMLGFDDYTSLEYMNYVAKTPKNFATDDVLIGEIIGALESSEEKDYIYAISVQGHGEYPTKKTIEDPALTVKGLENEETIFAWEYYLQQITEMDAFLKSLIEELEDYDEEVVLVLYGDHLPGLGMKKTDMKSGSTYKTQYVIWSNFDLKKSNKNLQAYQLSAEVQNMMNMRQGTLTALHQERGNNESYHEDLHLLQYDMLYGKKYIYGGSSPYEQTKIKMGYNPIKIDEVVEVADEYYIKGHGFTSFSKISLNDKILKTIFVGPTVIKLLEDVSPSDVSKLKVSQVEKYNSVLSTTE